MRQLLRMGMDGDVLSCWTGAALTASDASALVSDDSTAEDEPCLEDVSEPWGLGLAPWAPPGGTSATDSQAPCRQEKSHQIVLKVKVWNIGDLEKD